jgi:hypothetical protein
VLGSILTFAGTQSAASGAVLLFFYSLGLAVPFVAAALAFGWVGRRLAVVKRHYRAFQISAGAVLDTSALAKDDTNNPAVDRMRKALEGRIVLLGGSWKAARDEYPTPVGPLSGVEILGHAVLTALDPKGIAEVRGSTLTWYDLALGLGMVALSLRHPRLATLSNIAIFVLLLFVSGLLFRSFQLFLNTIPVQVSVMLHNLLHPVMHPYLERLLARGKH